MYVCANKEMFIEISAQIFLAICQIIRRIATQIHRNADKSWVHKYGD